MEKLEGRIWPERRLLVKEIKEEPTTMAGTLDLNVEAHKMKCVNPTAIKSSVAVGTWNYGHGD